MMDDRRISHGLTLLADEADPPAVDVHAVIATAKARSRNRKLVAATGVATAAVVGALAVVVGLTTPTPTDTTPAATTEPIFDERSERFGRDVYALIRDHIAKPDTNVLHAVSAETVPQPPVPENVKPLFRGVERDGHTAYVGNYTVADAEGWTMLEVWVVKEAPGLPVDLPSGTPHGPCGVEEPGCTEEVLSDGTVVRTMDADGLYVVFGKRPDGTVVEVKVAQAEPENGNGDLGRTVELDKLTMIVEAITY